MKKQQVEKEEQEEVAVEVSVNEDITEDEKKKLDEYQQQVAVQKSKKKKLGNLFLFLFNIVIVVAIVLWQVFAEGEFTSLGELNINIWFLLLAIVIFFLAQLLDGVPTAYLIKKACGRRRYALGFKSTIWSRYYEAITPMAAGGEAFQVTYLLSYDVPATAALSIPVARLFFIQLSCFIMSCAGLIMSFVKPSLGGYVSIVSYIGFALSSFVLLGNLFLAISKKTGKKLVVKVLKLLQKMKIVKDYEKQYKKVTKYIDEYQTTMIQYMKSPKDFFVMFVTIGVRTLFAYITPFLVYLIFNGTEGVTMSLFSDFFAMAVLIELAACFFPMPGGAGMSEISFGLMFPAYFGGSSVWAMLLYRFFNFYSYLLLGLVLTFYDFLYGKKKYRWLKKQRSLQAESVEFRQIQINNFRSERASRRKKQTKDA